MLEQEMLEIIRKQRKAIELDVNRLWELHDTAPTESEANYYATKAFELLERLPENQVYLTTRQ